MSGHSKWHSIRHKKAAVDAKRGKIFSRLVKEITVAAAIGGGDPANNPRLRTAVAAARDANMPMKNIDNAIKKGTGDLPGVTYEELTFEGYGPGGVAFMVNCTTDNRNRTAAEIRHLFSKNGGNLGETGCVAWMFERKGQIRVEGSADQEETVMMAALDAGALDVQYDGEGSFIITTEAEGEALDKVREALASLNLKIESASLDLIPSTTMELDVDIARRCLRLYDAFDEHEDVQSIASNFEIDDEVIAEYAEQ